MKSYAFDEVVVLLNGFRAEGFAEVDDAVIVERAKDSFLTSVGADGEMSVARNADRSADITLKMQQTSETNSFLSLALNAAENGAFAPIAISVKDLSGTDLIVGTKSVIVKPPTVTRGQGINASEWLLRTETAILSLGQGEDV